MSAATVADLFADLLAPAGGADPEGTPANAANPANRDCPRGFPAGHSAANGLRIAANPSPSPAALAADSQAFAGNSQRQNRPVREQCRGHSQDSQDSQGHTTLPRGAPADLDGNEAFEERAAILEFDAGLTRADAEAKAVELLAPAALLPAEVNQYAQAPVAASRDCRDCLHRLPRGTCGEPEAAGLFRPGHGFGIAWADDGHAARCSAFTSRTPAKADGRPYRLTRAEGDAAHADLWGDAAIARFRAREASICRRGFGEQDAEDLAERAHLLDLQSDGRALCLTCRNLAGSVATGWRCGDHQAAGLAPSLPPDLVTLPQRCGGYQCQGG